MDNLLAVSVIIPIYNGEAHIEQCLNSLLTQSLESFEIICVDDGSTDGTLGILREYERNYEKIQVLEQENLYAGVARNAGMKIAKGSYLVFLDGDDFFEPDLLELQYEACIKQDADISLCDGNRYNEVTSEFEIVHHFLKKEYLINSDFNRCDLKEKLFQVSSPAPWTKMYARKFIEKHKLEFQKLRTNNDTYFTTMAMALAEKITYVNKVLVHYRIGQTTNLQATDNKNPLEFCVGLSSIKEQLIKLGLYEELRWAFINRAVSVAHYHFMKQQKHPDVFSVLCEEFKNKYIDEFELDMKPEPEMLYEKYHKNIMNWVVRHEFNHSVLIADEKQPKVSVIIPVYNTDVYLDECISSISNQTLQEIEIICINDGSTDKSLDVLNNWKIKDERIQVYSQENQGQSVARNYGIDVAKGQYIYFMDSDDILEKEALEFLYNEARYDQLDVLYFDAITFYESNELKDKHSNYIKGYNYERVEELGDVYSGYEMMNEFQRINGYRVSPCLQLISRKYMEQEKIKFYEGIVHEDQIFNFITMLSAKRVSHRKKSLFKRRVREESTMTSKATFRRARGYIISYIEMHCFLKDLRIQEKYQEGIMATVENTRKNTMKRLTASLPLDGEILECAFERNQWDAVNTILSAEVVKLKEYDKYEKLKAQLELRSRELESSRESRKNLNCEYQKKKEKIEQQKFEIEQQKREQRCIQDKLKKMENRCAKNEQELANIYGSLTFKIGKAITFIPRKIKGILKRRK